jgi:hypothetical protein
MQGTKNNICIPNAENRKTNPFMGFIFVKTGRNTCMAIAEMVYFW